GRTRRHFRARDRMFHFATVARKIEFFCARGDGRRKAGAFLFEWTKEGGELIKIVLAPTFVGMMMALRAFHARAENKLAEERGAIRRFAAIAVNDRRAIAMIGAFGGKNFACELIERF